MRGIIVFAGSSHPELAASIAARLGLPLGRVRLSKFANAELSVEIQQSVRDMDVYIVQSSYGAVNDYLMELLIMIHACKIASAARVTVVLSCFPYSRPVANPTEKPLQMPLSERQEGLLRLFRNPSGCIDGYRLWAGRAGRLVASMIEEAGADHVITVDLHNSQFQGFFSIPLDNLPSSPLMIKYIKENIGNYSDAIIVSPDAGGAKRATELANLLGTGFALIHKNRDEDANATVTLVGTVEGKDAIMIDDMADTSGTLTQGAALLKEHGARRIYAAVTHGIFSDEALAKINDSDISNVIVSNTIPQTQHARECPKIRVFDMAPILAEAIRRMHNGESVSYLFSPTAFQ